MPRPVLKSQTIPRALSDRARARGRAWALGLLSLGVGLALAACDATPPTDTEMRDALQAAFDEEARQGSAIAGAMRIARFKAANCERTALVGPVIYACQVTIALGNEKAVGPDLAPRPVMFHKSDKGWYVPP